MKYPSVFHLTLDVLLGCESLLLGALWVAIVMLSASGTGIQSSD